MALREIDPNVPSRSSISRASNRSGKSSLRHEPATVGPSGSQPIAQNAGVLSMLKTTTEVGDIGLLASKSRIPRRPAPPRRPSNAESAGFSSQYSRAGSVRSQRSQASSRHSNGDQQMPGAWPYGQQAHAVSRVDVALPPPDSRSLRGHPSSASIASTTDRYEYDQRSYSLTTSGRPHMMPTHHRSASNLRHGGPPPPMPRSPYGHPTRMRRQEYRPASPALSDTVASSYSRQPGFRPRLGPRGYTNPAWGPAYHAAHEGQKYYQAQAYSSPMKPEPTWQQQSAPFGPFQGPPATSWREHHRVQAQFDRAEDQEAAYHSHTGAPSRQNPSPLSIESTAAPSNRPSQRTSNDRTPHAGFVQRVKQVLEERGSLDHFRPAARAAPLASNQANWQDPENAAPAAELPASPVVVKRLTRDMIKAAVGPPSDTGAVSPDAPASVASGVLVDDSSGEDSSLRARDSSDAPGTSSSPELVNSGSSIAHTVPSSIDEPPPTDADRAASPLSVSKPIGGMSSDENYTVSQPAPAEVLQDEAQTVKQLQPPRTFLAVQPLISTNNATTRPFSVPLSAPLDSSGLGCDRQSLPTSAIPGAAQSPSVRAARLSREEPVTEGNAPSEHAGGCTPVTVTDHGPAHAATHVPSRPPSRADPLNWAASSIMARQSFQLDNSTRSSVSTLVEPQQGPRVELTAAPAHDEQHVPHAYPNRDSMASIESPVLSVSHALPPGEPRLSAARHFHFPLPDLTEDSQEDASTTNLRMLGSKPPPFRAAAYKKARREPRMLPRSDVPSKIPQPARSYLSNKLADTRNMPSLNFSHTDLTTKLNLALGMSSPLGSAEASGSRSKDDTNTQRGLSAAEKQQRYKSFFWKFEDPPLPQEQPAAVAEVARRNSTAWKNEIDRLSIPSVNGLTVRLSELLPSMQQLESLQDVTKSDGAVTSTVDHIRDLGSPERMASIEHKRASLLSALSAGTVAQLRRSGGSPMHNVPPRGSSIADVDKDLPRLPNEGRDPRPSLATVSTAYPAETEDESLNDPAPELEATVPVELDNGAPTEVRGSISQQPKKVGSKRPATTDPSHGKGTSEEVSSEAVTDDDPTIAVPAASKSDTPDKRQGRPQLKTRRSRSMMDLPSGQAQHVIRSMSPGPHMEADLVPRSDDASEHEQHVRAKKGIMGSLQRRMGVGKTHVDNPSWHVDPAFLHPEERAVPGPGDRYPTTSLTPPSQVNMDEVRSYFSDDSSLDEEVRAGALRRRLARLKNRQSAQDKRRGRTSQAMSGRGSRLEEHRPNPMWMQSIQSLSTASHTGSYNQDLVVIYDNPPAGMSKLEFRVKRAWEKFRILWCRSGEAVRSISRNQKHRPGWNEGSEVYDGT